jgi:CheY-like chemotaxis protein
MNRTVLVVDDDRQVLSLLEALLTRAGYSVRLAEGAVQAMEWLEKERPGAVVLDIMMPVRSGIEVLEHIRWKPNLAGLPVIVLSAIQLTKEEQDFVAEFTVGFVDKGNIQQVLEHLERVLRPGRNPLAADPSEAP